MSMGFNCPKCGSEAASAEIVGPGQASVTPCECVTHPKDLPTGVPEKPHNCDLCGAGFTERGSMLRHKRDVHGVSDDLSCQECGEVFGTPEALGGHVVAAHGSAQKTQFTSERMEAFWSDIPPEERREMVKQNLGGFGSMESHSKWKGGVHYQTQRKIVEKERGVPFEEMTCDVCGATPGEDSDGDTRLLSVHHKNGDDTDNRSENLSPLCPRCHRSVHNKADHALMGIIKDEIPDLHTLALLESLKQAKQNPPEGNESTT